MKIKLEQLCEALKLRGMSMALNDVLISAEQEQHAFTHSLQLLLDAEYKYRQERSLTNRVRLAKLPTDWTLATFPFEHKPEVNKSQIMNLASLDFIHRLENVIFIGPPGVGKSGLAMGLLRAALVNGYHGRFYNAQELLDDLYASLADRSTGKLISALSRCEILLVDELGYLTLNTEQVNAFFKLMDMRYGRKSTIITTNLEFEQWYGLFNNKPLVDALLDRLKHRCTVIKVAGSSIRELEAKSSAKACSKISKALSAK